MIPPNAAAATITIIILTLNQREKTLQCLAHIQNVPGPPHKIVVWDNGSTDGTVEAIRAAFPDVLAHHHTTNLGVSSGRNAAAKLAIERFQPTYLLFLDNDILIEPNFVQALLQPFEEDSTIGQTQAKLRFLDDRECLNDAGGARIQFWIGRTRPVGYGEIDRGQYDTLRPCISCGGAMMVRTDVFQQLGGFDPAFDPFGPEDLDFSLRLQKAGYKAMYVPQALGFHQVSHTFEGESYSEKYARHKSRHWFVFMRRHAPPAQKLGFLLFGAPYLVVRMMIREGRKGNFGALRGVVRGMIDFWGSAPRATER